MYSRITLSIVSYLIADSYSNMSHFNLPPFTDPQTLALHVLNPDVNTCGIRAVNAKNTSQLGCDSVVWSGRLTFRAVWGRLIGWRWPLNMYVCVAVGGGEDSGAQIIWRVLRVLQREDTFRISPHDFILSFIYRHPPSLRSPSAMCPGSWNRTVGRLEVQGTGSGLWCLQLHLERETRGQV